eukprot:GEZU01014276.1.p1 GENE.GEZU01014276.1~~GEZU01014276.1.p1  ORF type:complete len:260 (-),score=86.57 GEZU01014276.1:178-924(-)
MSSNEKKKKNVLVIGAHGLTGQELCKQLSQRSGIAVTALVRPGKEDHKRDLQKLGVNNFVEADLASSEDLQQKLKEVIPKHQAVAFVAGAASKLSNPNPDPALFQVIDKQAACQVADLCADSRVPLFLLSAFGVQDEELIRGGGMSERMQQYMRAKREADEYIVRLGKEHGLRYIIFRPGPLTTEPASGKKEKIVIKENPRTARDMDNKESTSISRGDLAFAMADAIASDTGNTTTPLCKILGIAKAV